MKKLVLVLSLLTLTSCDKKIKCGFFEAPIKIMSGYIAKAGDCDAAILEAELKKQFVKIKVCSEESNYASINGSNLLCTIVPDVVKMLGDSIGAKASCKKVGELSADAIKKAMSCN